MQLIPPVEGAVSFVPFLTFKYRINTANSEFQLVDCLWSPYVNLLNVDYSIVNSSRV